MKFTIEHLGLAAQQSAGVLEGLLVCACMLDAKVVFENSQNPPGFFVSFAAGTLIEIYQGESTLAETGNNSLAGWRHLAVQVESIEAARTELERRGVKFIDPVKPAGGGGRVLFFRDGEGNLLHLVERPAGSMWIR